MRVLRDSHVVSSKPGARTLFTYLDPKIRTRLIEQGSLIRIDTNGERIDPSADASARGEHTLDILGPIPMPISLGERELKLQWYAMVRSTELASVDELATSLREQGRQQLFSVLTSSMVVNSVLIYGDPLSGESPLVRVHSSCLTGDVFGSQRCECGPQLLAAVDRIAAEPDGGAIIYMAGHEGRGIGLWAKAATYILQDGGEDTYQANRSLGLPDDSRDFSDAAAVLRYFFGTRALRLLTNNPKKVEDLKALGLNDITPVKHVVGVNDWNRRYLAAKRDWGHGIGDGDLVEPGSEP